MYKVLLADPSHQCLQELEKLPYFRERGEFQIEKTATTSTQVLEDLRDSFYDVALLHVRLAPMGGLELLKVLRQENLCQNIVLIGECPTVPQVRECLVNGVLDYLVKPICNEMVENTFDRIYHQLQTSRRQRYTDQIIHSVLYGSPTLLNGLLARAYYIMLGRSNPTPELCVYAEQMLSSLYRQVLVEAPCLHLYIPLIQLCSLPTDVTDYKGYAETIALNLLFLQEKLKLFCPTSNHPLIRQVWNYVIMNIEGSVRLQPVAEHFFVNKNYLSLLFKKETGIHYKDFVTALKLERAKMLLSDPNIKIYELADRLQFRETEYFSRIFKSQVGIPPSQFDYGVYLDRCRQIIASEVGFI